MPERLSICCLFDEAPLDQRSVFLKLFAVDPTWMGRPSKFMVFNIKTGTMTEGDWPPPDYAVQRLLEEEILFVYSDWATSPIHFRSSASLKETNEPIGRAVYTLGFPVSLLRNNIIADVERRFFHICDVAASIGKCSILIGPELELDPTLSSEKVIASALDPASLATWIIAAEEHLPKDIQPFEAMAKSGGTILLRHPDAAQRVGLSITVAVK